MKTASLPAFLVVLGSTLALGTLHVRAQNDFNPNRTEAARLFEAATEHADRGQTAEALELFRRSLATFPTTATAFNLALTLHDTGRVVEAIELIERLVDGEYGDLPPSRLAEAREQRRLYRTEVATLDVLISGVSSANVRVDGTRVGETRPEDPLRVRVDPGSHVVTAHAGPETRETEIEATRGHQTEVELVFSGVAPEGDGPSLVSPPGGRSADDSDSTIFEEPWFWVVSALVVAGAAVGAVFLLQDGETAEPAPLFGRHEVLRAAW